MGAIALVGILNRWTFIPAGLAAVAMLVLRKRFARCLRDLKRIEGITRSPVFSQLSSTINGLKVIRSYRAESICSEEFLRYLDDNTRVNYLLLTTNRWAAIRFDWIALGFIILVTLLAMLARTMQQNFSAADIALTLSYSLNLMGLLQWTIRFVSSVSLLSFAPDQDPSPLQTIGRGRDTDDCRRACPRVLCTRARATRSSSQRSTTAHQLALARHHHLRRRLHVSLTRSPSASRPLPHLARHPRRRESRHRRTNRRRQELLHPVSLSHGHSRPRSHPRRRHRHRLARSRRRASTHLHHSTGSRALHRHHAQQPRPVRRLCRRRDLAGARAGAAEEAGDRRVGRRSAVDGERERVESERGSEAAGVSGEGDTEAEQDLGDRRGDGERGQCVSSYDYAGGTR